MNANPETAVIEMPADVDLVWAEREQKRRHRAKVDSAAAQISARFDLDAYLQTQGDDYPIAA